MSETTITEVPATEEPVKIPSPMDAIKSKLTKQECEDFFKMFISDQPYEDTITTFGGRLKLRFRSLSVAENALILQQQRFDGDNGIMRTDDAYVLRVIQYRIASSLVSINDVPFYPSKSKTENKDEKNTYLIQCLAEMGNWPIFKLSNITDAYNRFEQKVVALTEESFKENF